MKTNDKTDLLFFPIVFGACLIDSTGIFFIIAVLMILVPSFFIIKRGLREIKSEIERKKCMNEYYLLDLSTRSDMFDE